MKKQAFLSLIFILHFCITGIAQQPVWQRIGIDEGLPDPNVTALAKSADGRLFVGTAIGLFSYDGFSFTRIEFQSKPAVNPYINSLIISNNKLYIGSRDAISSMNLSNNSIETFYNPLNAPGGIIELTSEAGKVYAITNNGIMVFNETGNLKNFTHIKGLYYRHLRADTNGILHAYLFRKMIVDAGKTSTITLFSDPGILDAYWWKKENVWLIAKPDGIYSLSVDYRIFKKTDLNVKININENKWFYDDHAGNIWLQCAGYFAKLTSLNEKNPGIFYNEPDNPFSFTSNTAQAFCTEPNGKLWVGGDGTGLSFLDPVAAEIQFIANEKFNLQHFWTFRYEPENSALYCGTTSGLLIATYDGSQIRDHHVYAPPGKNRFSVNAVVPLNQDEYILSVYREGFWKFDRNSKKLTELKNVNERTGIKFVYGIREISGDRLILLTQYNAFILDKKSLKTEVFKQPVFHNYSVFAIIENTNGDYLIGGGFGLQTFGTDLNQTGYFCKDSTEGLSSNVIFDILESSPGNYFLATMGGGLVFYDEAKSKFRKISLTTDPENIFGITKPDPQHLLLTTSNGLNLLNIDNGKSVVINKSNFLPFNDFNQSALYCGSGMTIAGGEKGAILIKTDSVRSMFHKFNRIVVRSGNTITDNLILNPGQHSFELKLSLNDIVPSKKLRFAYRIKGIDDDFQLLPYGQNTLIYNFLPPGEYSLEVRLIDETNLVNAIPATVYIKVKPFFYQTLWFRILALLLFTGIIFLIVRYFALLRLRWKVNKLDAERKVMLERARISRELHDNLGSQLTYMISGLETTELLLKRNNLEKTTQNLEKMQTAARDTMQQLRDSIWALKPGSMTFLSLIAEFEKWLFRITEPSDTLQVNLKKPDCEDFIIEPTHGLNIYRILQEAVHNSVKYSGASELNCVFSCEKNLVVMRISDNGKGFNQTQSGGNGLGTMKHRAGEVKADLQIITSAGTGCIIQLILDKNTLNG